MYYDLTGTSCTKPGCPGAFQPTRQSEGTETTTVEEIVYPEFDPDGDGEPYFRLRDRQIRVTYQHYKCDKCGQETTEYAA